MACIRTLRRIDGVQDHAAYAFRMVTYHGQCQERSIGGSIQVYLIIPKCQPQIIDIGSVLYTIICSQVDTLGTPIRQAFFQEK